MTVITANQIESIVNEVWEAYTSVRLRIPMQRSGEPREADDFVTGRVFINGAWRGSVEVECSRPLAVRAAASMLGGDAEAMSVSDLKDALGELTNIIGGNIKSLLPGPSHLSLPAVWEGGAAAARPAYESLLDRATLNCGDQPVRISVWHHVESASG